MDTRSVDLVVHRQEITDAAASAFADSSSGIPERYIRTEEDLDGVVAGEDESYELPVIDMSRLLHPETSAQESHKLGAACRTWGFFQLTNHGVEEAVIQQMKDSTEQFFRLPLESKRTVGLQENGLEGFGHYYSRGSDKLDWAESVILLTQPVEARNLDLWPRNPPTFRCALESYSVEIGKLALQILRFMAADLGLREEALRGAFTGHRQSLVLHHYPPCRHPEKVIGVAPHTDTLGLTLLLPLDDTPGLQVMKDRRWFPVRPVPEALVINVADTLDVLTNGAYRSVQHRVVPDAKRGRTTVVMFQEAAVEGGLVAPLLRDGDDEEPRYRSIPQEEYVIGNFKALAQGTRFIDSLKI